MIKRDDGTYDLWLMTLLGVIVLALVALVGAVLTNTAYRPQQLPAIVHPIDQHERQQQP